MNISIKLYDLWIASINNICHLIHTLELDYKSHLGIQYVPSTWRSEPLIEMVGVETRVEWKTGNNFLLCLPKPISPPSPHSLIGFDRQRRKLLLLSAFHSTRISTPTTSISGPGLHVDGTHDQLKQLSSMERLIDYSCSR